MKQDVNLAICGHAWHGKSTLVGKTVAELGMIGRRKLEQFERLAQAGRDPSLVFALMVFRQKDVTNKTDEAARGITVLPSFVRFEFESHRVTVIDTPGQETYTNNRFAGMFSADCAALVVDVVDGVQLVTEQALRVIKGYEIPLVGVVITKMDKVGYARDRFEDTVELTRMALQEHGLRDDIPFVPTSAYASGRPIMDPGEGVTRVSERMGWYDGLTFHGLMGTLDLRRIRPEKPVRVVIHSADVHAQVPGVGTAFTGLIEAGTLRKDQTLIFEPASTENGERISGEVRSVELTKGHIATPGVPLSEGHPRQLVGVALRKAPDELRSLLRGRGTVAGTPDAPPRVARRFIAEVTVFDADSQIKVGQQLTMHAHVDKVPVAVERIEDPGAPEQDRGAEGAPVRLSPGRWAHVTFAALRPVAIEEASVLAPLSKLVLRQTNKPIGLGRCVRIVD